MSLDNVKSDAFISYRHCELDSFISENLHKKLESYKLPNPVIKKIGNGRTKIERVFRDEAELPLSNNLSDPITLALDNSEFLIVICTPRLKESLWCKKEIETFVSTHDRKHVLLVLAEGEPEASLYAVMSEKSEEAEVSVFSSSDDSEIEVVCATETDAEIAAEVGLEVVENYLISEREEESDETLFVKAEQNDDAELLPCESMSIYSVDNEELNDVIIEDIAEEKGLCEIDNDVTEFALVKDSGFRHMNFELHPKKDEKSTVTLEGMMPKDATAEAVDVTGETASSGDADESKSVVAAYDITIKDGKDEYQPSEDRPIAVEIMCSDIKADDEFDEAHKNLV